MPRRSVERVVKALADVAGSPAGLLLLIDDQFRLNVRRQLELAACDVGHGAARPITRSSATSKRRGKVVDFERVADGLIVTPATSKFPVPEWMANERRRLGRRAAAPFRPSRRPGDPFAPDRSGAARLGGFRPVPDRRHPGGELSRRGAQPGGARQRAALRRIQPPLRLHHPRHQESGQPAQPGRAQRRAARRQSRFPGRHGRDPAKLGQEDERPARPAQPRQQCRGRGDAARRRCSRW